MKHTTTNDNQALAREAVAQLIEYRQNNPPGAMTCEEGNQLSRLLDKMLE